VVFFEQARELRRGRRLTGTLKADHHDAGDVGLLRVLDRLAAVLHHRDELVLTDLDEVLLGADFDLLALEHDLRRELFADRLLLHRREEPLHHAELDVRVEEREANLSQRGLDVLSGELGDSGETVARCFEAFGEGFEHRREPERRGAAQCF
jgi:hypothetical protein